MPRLATAVLFVTACSTPAPAPDPIGLLPGADDVRFAALAPVHHEGTWHAIPVGCVTQQGDVIRNDACAPRLSGLRATLPAGSGDLGEVTSIACASTGREALGLTLRIQRPMENTGSWGFLGDGIPHTWHIASYYPDPQLAESVLQAVAGSGWSLSTTAQDPVIIERLNLGGTRVIEANAAGQSAMLLAGSDIIALPTDGLSVPGLVTTPGAMPILNNGHLLVLTSAWPGGSSVHAVHLSPEGPATIGEWSCPR